MVCLFGRRAGGLTPCAAVLCAGMLLHGGGVVQATVGLPVGDLPAAVVPGGSVRFGSWPRLLAEPAAFQDGTEEGGLWSALPV